MSALSPAELASIPETMTVFMLNGKGWWSPELCDLIRDYGDGLVRQACDELGIDARRQNVAALRNHLQAWEARLK